MRVSVLLAVLLLLPAASAQLPHPSESVVHHPLTIESELRQIRDTNPDFISMDSYGTSVSGFSLWYLDFAHPDADKDALPTYYLDANHHGNEQLGMEALIIFLEELAEWSKTAEGGDRLKQVRVVAAPMINPDGTGTDRRVNNNGVDLNRNYDFNWGLYGTGNTPNLVTGNYRGPSPLSEPETAANAALMREIGPDIYLSMHTGSHDIVLPWRQAPDADGPIPDWDVFEQYLAGVKDVSGLEYRDPSGAGESISYGYGALGALSVIVEVDTTQFQMVITDIRERLKEEVQIYWYTLDTLEEHGGYITAGGGHILSVGRGAAYNVTFLDKDGQTLSVIPAMAPDAEADVPRGAATVTWERRIQGELMKPVWSATVAGLGHEPVDDSEAPLPLIVVLAGLGIVLALRRRPT